MLCLFWIFALVERSCGLFGLTVCSAVGWVVWGGVVFNAEGAESRKEREKFACGWGEREVDCDENTDNTSKWMYVLSSTFLISFEWAVEKF
jgi:hypothetical protein